MRSAQRTSHPTGPATYQDVLDLPEHLIGEIVGGEMLVSPRPAVPHAEAAGGLFAQLRMQSAKQRGGGGGAGGWWIVTEPELHLRGEVLVPDIAGWRRERVPQRPTGAAVEIVPDWVCEVVSPRYARRDRIQKASVYARLRVPWMWLVDPLEQTLEIYELTGDLWTRVQAFGGLEVIRARPFDAVELDMAEWWMEELLVPEKGNAPAPSRVEAPAEGPLPTAEERSSADPGLTEEG